MIPGFTIDEFITGEQFERCCDIDFDTRVEGQLKPFEIPEELRGRKVLKVFVQTHNLNHYMPQIAACTAHKFVVVTQNSDGGIVAANPRPFDYQWRTPPDNVVHMFCQNVDVRDAKLTAIPIGIENSYVLPKVRKPAKMLDLMGHLPAWNERKLWYVCHHIGTNPKVRYKPYELYARQSWATVRVGLNGRSFDEYIADIAAHKCVCSPDGNGIDCVRTWETLYLGAVPVVMRHECNEQFLQRGLPMIIVDEYDDVSQADLVDSVVYHWNRDREPLKMSYWRKLIQSYCE